MINIGDVAEKVRNVVRPLGADAWADHLTDNVIVLINQKQAFAITRNYINDYDGVELDAKRIVEKVLAGADEVYLEGWLAPMKITRLDEIRTGRTEWDK